MTQWHPIFAYLLRHTMQDYYEVQTNVPVGDLPREADILLLRRAGKGKPPFRSIWRHLTRWNILEFKGRSESARLADIDLLLEVGLGIDRRLREQEPKIKLSRRDVSFWYLANHLGKRFLRDVVELIGTVDPIAPGLWRGHVVGRPIWLVSNGDVPADWETAPVRMVSEQTVEQAFELANVATSNDELWELYGPWLGTLFPIQRQEFEIMATKRGRREITPRFILENAIKTATPTEHVEVGSAKMIIDKIGLDAWLAVLTPEQRRELAKRMESEKK